MSTTSIGFAPLSTPAADATRSVQPVAIAAQTQEAKTSTQTSTSLALLYRTAIDRINEMLTPELGPNAIGNAVAPVQTPEATAGRIVAMTTAFYDAYAGHARNKGKDPDVLIQDFVNLIRGGFEKGFGEAKDILSGLGVMGKDSPIEQGINQTYALVMQGFDDFLASKLSTKPAAATVTAAAPKDSNAT